MSVLSHYFSICIAYICSVKMVLHRQHSSSSKCWGQKSWERARRAALTSLALSYMWSCYCLICSPTLRICRERRYITLVDILQFFSGASEIPAIGFDSTPKIYFTSEECLPPQKSHGSRDSDRQVASRHSRYTITFSRSIEFSEVCRDHVHVHSRFFWLWVRLKVLFLCAQSYTLLYMLSSNMHYTSHFILLLHTFSTVINRFPTYTFVICISILLWTCPFLSSLSSS